MPNFDLIGLKEHFHAQAEVTTEIATKVITTADTNDQAAGDTCNAT